jgi:cystathionine beta-lyase/cystathionine gamma-synthase
VQRPLGLGADYVAHSLTKYLSDHGDALSGVVLGPAEGCKRIRKQMLVHLGGAMSPFNAWLIQRGLLVADLDQALRGRTFKGVVGPLAYRLMR